MSPGRLSYILAVLREARPGLSAEELLDVVWVARLRAAPLLALSRVAASAHEVAPGGTPVPTAGPSPFTGPADLAPEDAVAPGSPAPDVAAGAPAAADGAGGGAVAVRSVGAGPGSRAPAVPIRLPRGRAMVHSGPLLRALKPLRLWEPSATDLELDEEATAEQWGLWGRRDLRLAVLRPRRRKARSLFLLLDRSVGTRVWGRRPMCGAGWWPGRGCSARCVSSCSTPTGTRRCLPPGRHGRGAGRPAARRLPPGHAMGHSPAAGRALGRSAGGY